jgi:YHS domain-containing protein
MEFIIENWWYILLLMGFGYIMFNRGGCCGGGHSHGGHDHTGHNGGNGQYGSSQMNNQIEMVLDPECGMYINPETAIRQNIDGQTYYFCSENCRSSFARKHEKL